MLKYLIIFAILGLSATTALRDALTEVFFAHDEHAVDVPTTFFIYLATTEVACLIWLAGSGQLRAAFRSFADPRSLKQLVLLNVYSFLAYFCYFVAIASPLSAGLVSFVDYSTLPLFTALLALVLDGTRLPKQFWPSLGAGVIGLTIFICPRAAVSDGGSGLFFGVAVAIASAISSGLTTIYIKRLLHANVIRPALLFGRFALATVGLGFYLLLRPENPEVSGTALASLTSLGLLGFFVPMALMIYLLQKVSINLFSLTLVAIPVMTTVLSTVFGHETFNLLDVISGLILCASILYFERSERTENQACVIVDAYSSGKLLAEEFASRGYRMVHVKSSPHITEHFLASYPSRLFHRELVYDDNFDVVIRELKREDAICVIAGTETGVNLADRLSERLHLLTNGTKNTEARRNKYLMIEALQAAGLKSAQHFRSSDVEAIIDWIDAHTTYPVVLKPLESAGSDGVRICNTEAGVREGFAAIVGTANKLGLANTDALVESFLEGDEYIINTVSHRGQHKVTDICLSTKRPSSQGDLVYDAITLLDFDGEKQKRMEAYFFKVLDALGIQNGPAHGEIMYEEDGPVLIEVGARLAGVNLPKIFGDCVSYSSVEATVDTYIDPARFYEKAARPVVREKHSKVVYLASHHAGEIRSAPKETLFANLPSFVELDWHIDLGDRLEMTTNLFSSPGFVVLAHEDEETLLDDYFKVRNAIEPRLYRKVQDFKATFSPMQFDAEAFEIPGPPSFVPTADGAPTSIRRGSLPPAGMITLSRKLA